MIRASWCDAESLPCVKTNVVCSHDSALLACCLFRYEGCGSVCYLDLCEPHHTINTLSCLVILRCLSFSASLSAVYALPVFWLLFLVRWMRSAYCLSIFVMQLPRTDTQCYYIGSVGSVASAKNRDAGNSHATLRSTLQIKCATYNMRLGTSISVGTLISILSQFVITNWSKWVQDGVSRTVGVG